MTLEMISFSVNESTGSVKVCAVVSGKDSDCPIEANFYLKLIHSEGTVTGIHSTLST